MTPVHALTRTEADQRIAYLRERVRNLNRMIRQLRPILDGPRSAGATVTDRNIASRRVNDAASNIREAYAVRRRLLADIADTLPRGS